MKKKLFIIFTAVAVILILLFTLGAVIHFALNEKIPVGDGPVEKKTSQGLEYELAPGGKEYYVIGIGTCTDKDIYVPLTHEDLPVTKIWEGAFSGLDITSLRTQRNINEIGQRALKECTSLSSVTIADGLRTLGTEAFMGCSSLTSVSLPSSIRRMGSSAFEYCTSLKIVTIGENAPLDALSGRSFYNCTSLEEVNLLGDSKINVIGEHTFSECTSLRTITFHGKSPLVEIREEAFSQCTSLESLVFTEGTTLASIRKSAFKNCKKLTTLPMYKYTETVEEFAFENCISLKELHVREKLIVFPSNAFASASFESITVDKQNPVFKVEGGCLLSADGSVLYKAVKGSKIPEGVKTIAEYALSGHTDTKEIVIPSSVTRVNTGAFEGCTSLKRLYIPKETKSFNVSNIKNCPSLTDIIFTGTKYMWTEYARAWDIATHKFDNDVTVTCSDGILTYKKGQ